jgi:FkbM family methyltransferase
LKTLLKKILPKSLITKLIALRNASFSAEEKRAQLIGMNRSEFRQFMEDPEGALKLTRLHLFGAPKKVSFLKESKNFIVECVFDDAYQLEKIPLPKDKHCTIIDVGANVGAFAMAARGYFPHATIHCYEPHPALEPYLRLQAYAVGAKYYEEAVGLKEGSFASDEMQNEILQSESVKIMDFTKEGNVKTVSLKTAIERIGGHVDLLKLDCEGSEWSILQDKNALKNVDILVFEFHRLSPDGAFDIYDRSINVHERAKKVAKEAGFEILIERYHSIDAGIIVARHVR